MEPLNLEDWIFYNGLLVAAHGIDDHADGATV
jgi:hypothetical protein